MRNAIAHILCLAALAWTGGALAQDTTKAAAPANATDYFNKASKEFVRDRKPEALRTLDKALHEFPGDPRLLKLAEELVKEQEQQQQKQQQQQQKQDEQQKKEQDQAQQDQQKKQEQDQAQEQQKKDQQQQQGQEQQAQQQPGIAPRDAQRILDALQREEKDVQQRARMRTRMAQRRPIEKDW